MKEAAEESAALKMRFRRFFKEKGIASPLSEDAGLPDDLKEEAKEFPEEYGEAWSEYNEDPTW